MANSSPLRGVLLTEGDRQPLGTTSPAVGTRTVSKHEALTAIEKAYAAILPRMEDIEASSRAVVEERLAKREALRQLALQVLDLDERACEVLNKRAGSQVRTPVRKAYPDLSLAQQIKKLAERRSKWAGIL